MIAYSPLHSLGGRVDEKGYGNKLCTSWFLHAVCRSGTLNSATIWQNFQQPKIQDGSLTPGHQRFPRIAVSIVFWPFLLELSWAHSGTEFCSDWLQLDALPQTTRLLNTWNTSTPTQGLEKRGLFYEKIRF